MSNPLPTRKVVWSALQVSRSLVSAARLMDEVRAAVDGVQTVTGYRVFKNVTVAGSIIDDAIATLSPAIFLMYRVKAIEREANGMSKRATARKAAVKEKARDARVKPKKKKAVKKAAWSDEPSDQ